MLDCILTVLYFPRILFDTHFMKYPRATFKASINECDKNYNALFIVYRMVPTERSKFLASEKEECYDVR